MNFNKYKCYAYINKITWSKGNHGYANGYVVIPKEHPFFEKDYDEHIEITNLNDVKNYAKDNYFGMVLFDPNKNKLSLDILIPVHGGVTYANKYVEKNTYEFLTEKPENSKEYWVLGFDTLHYNDTKENWNEENCKKETLKLLSFLEDIDNVEYIVKR